MLALRSLVDGTHFQIGSRTCVLLFQNESEARVRIIAGPDFGKTIGWSLGTEIDRIVTTAEIQRAKEAVTYVCPTCQKECSSQSGLTLHLKQHTPEHDVLNPG